MKATVTTETPGGRTEAGMHLIACALEKAAARIRAGSWLTSGSVTEGRLHFSWGAVVEDEHGEPAVPPLRL